MEEIRYSNQDQHIQPRSLGWKFVYGLVAFLLLLSLLTNLLGLSNWVQVSQVPVEDLTGLTESQILEKFGPPDYRSPIQPFLPDDGFGMIPRKLEEGEMFFYLNFTIDSRPYVFHFVSPQTYANHTGSRIEGSEWIVLEYYRGASFVIY